MGVRVIYSTDAIQRNCASLGMQTERSFSSLDEAKDMPIPKGYSFGFIPVENGRYVYHSSVFGWEFQEANG